MLFLIFNFSALEPQKLSGWNFALIIVGVILFVVGVCVAIALAVLLTRRIKADCMFTTGDLYLTLLYLIACCYGVARFIVQNKQATTLWSGSRDLYRV